jgi:hypothetical protein
MQPIFSTVLIRKMVTNINKLLEKYNPDCNLHPVVKIMMSQTVDLLGNTLIKPQGYS